MENVREQENVVRAVNVPVFLSSLCQLPMIKTAVSDQKKIAILAASGDNIGEEVLQKVGSTIERLVVENIGDLPPYAKAIQQVSGLPVFDFNTMIDLVYHAVVQRTYYGYF